MSISVLQAFNFGLERLALTLLLWSCSCCLAVGDYNIEGVSGGVIG